MIFSSLYLDSYNNWHQQASQQQLIGIFNENSQQLQPRRPLSPPPLAGSIRPDFIADRTGLTKIAQPETPLQCPRCESTDTKFCYFNNYSLSQPRHFCKTCRRYWTRGGSLRNIPVGGNCRRNKKISKSPAVVNQRNSTSSCSTSSLISSSSRGTDNMLNHVFAAQSIQIPFLTYMHLLGGYSSSEIGLDIGGIHTAATSNNGGHRIGMDRQSLSSGISEQWRLQQYPFLSNFETSVTVPSGVQGQPVYYVGEELRASSKQLDDIDGITQLDLAKMEENQSLKFSKNFPGIARSDQYWEGRGSAWAGLSAYTSSSTSHLL